MFSYAIITVSDTCYEKLADDKSGVALKTAVETAFPSARLFNYTILPDEKDKIVTLLNLLCGQSVNLILTTGGTGLSKRDVTPEATREVIEKEVPGITQTMLIKSLEVTDMAMLSRAVAGTKGDSLIINLPGSVKGALECFGFIKSVVTHAIDLILDRKDEVKVEHCKIQEGEKVKSLVKVVPSAWRNRTSPYSMLDCDDAFQLVIKYTKNLNDIEEIDIANSLNRVLASDIVSKSPFPPFRASIKDGYAVKYSDGLSDRLIKNGFAAGDNPGDLVVQSGEAVRVSTGGCIPNGADAVVQVEDTSVLECDKDGNEIKIKILKTPYHNQDIRLIGSDIQGGKIIFGDRQMIRPAHIGIFATLGYSKIKVHRRARIGILSTGNELYPHNAKELPPNHIRDSNKLTLLNLLKVFDYTATDLGIVKDDPNLLKQALYKALERHDILITTGGVSMGEYDLMKEVLKVDFGAIIHFGRVNMKPGKPTTFATCEFKGSPKIIFALPGNPVSATVTCRLFVIPALRTFECSIDDTYNPFLVSITTGSKNGDRPEFRRVLLKDGKTTYESLKEIDVGDQISSNLNSCATANALMLIPKSSELITEFSTVMLYK